MNNFKPPLMMYDINKPELNTYKVKKNDKNNH